MKRPIVGLTGGRIAGSELVGNLDVLAESPVDVFYADYSQAILAAGGLPIFLPLDVSPAEVVGLVDAILVTGGNDIEPLRYGAEPESLVYPFDVERDRFELEVLDVAVAEGIPTLGICRGVQIINVFFGGTLLQHVPVHAGLDAPATRLHHDIELQPDSVLGGLYGETLAVNSLHHQAVDVLADELVATARSADGGIEGIEHRSLPIVAVQWHPEMLPAAAEDPLFRWLTTAG